MYLTETARFVFYKHNLSEASNQFVPVQYLKILNFWTNFRESYSSSNNKQVLNETKVNEFTFTQIT